MRATKGNCFIKPSWNDEEKSGRFFLPSVRNRELPCMGIVQAIADGEPIKIGDRVLYDRHKQQLMDVRGDKLALVKIEDVIALIS
jgi:co-chaperonin GroES (HSP10)